MADGYKAHFIPLDVTSKASICNAAEKIKSDYKGLDILINNAGIMYSSSKVRFLLPLEYFLSINHPLEFLVPHWCIDINTRKVLVKLLKFLVMVKLSTKMKFD